MQKVHVHDAVGMVLCHDITQIIPGEFKGRAFKKGHVIEKQDVPKLLELGKEHIYVWDPALDMVHENEAAERIARAAAGDGIVFTEPNQGKVSLIAEYDGLLQVNVQALRQINSIEQVVLATLHNHYLVKKGQVVAGTRVIPLVIEENKICLVENVCQNQDVIVGVKPFRRVEVGIVTTGNEVYYGRTKDGFGPVVKKKIEEFNGLVMDQVYVPDNAEGIAVAIRNLAAQGIDLIVVTGGMSVDPDDVTPLGIRLAGAEVVSYGAPVLPGSMSFITSEVARGGRIMLDKLKRNIDYLRISVTDCCNLRCTYCMPEQGVIPKQPEEILGLADRQNIMPYRGPREPLDSLVL